MKLIFLLRSQFPFYPLPPAVLSSIFANIYTIITHTRRHTRCIIKTTLSYLQRTCTILGSEGGFSVAINILFARDYEIDVIYIVVNIVLSCLLGYTVERYSKLWSLFEEPFEIKTILGPGVKKKC